MKIRIELEKKEATTLFNLADKTFKQINEPISSDRAQHIREYIERDKDNKKIVERKAYGEFHANGLCFDFSFNPRVVELVVEFFGNVITSCIAMFMSFMGMLEGIKAMGENFVLKFKSEFPVSYKYRFSIFETDGIKWPYIIKCDQYGNWDIADIRYVKGNSINHKADHEIIKRHFENTLLKQYHDNTNQMYLNDIFVDMTNSNIDRIFTDWICDVDTYGRERADEMHDFNF